MKVVFLKFFILSVANLFYVGLGLSAENGASNPEVRSKSNPQVRIEEIQRYPLVPQRLPAVEGYLSPKFFSASELRSNKNQSSFIGDVGLQLGLVHHLYFRGQRVNRNNGTSIDRYRVSYRWNLRDQTSLSLNSTNIDHGSGSTRTDFGFGVRQGISTKFIKSSFNFSYKNAEDIFTQVEARYNVAKNLQSLPLRLSSNIKWRQREFSAGAVVGSIGGSVGLRYNIQPRFSVTLTHNIKDDLSAETTSLTGSFSKNFGSNTVIFKMGTVNEQTAFFRVQSLLNI